MAYGDLNDYTNLAAIGWRQTIDCKYFYCLFINTVIYVRQRSRTGNQITDKMICVTGGYNEGTCTISVVKWETMIENLILVTKGR